MSNVKQTLVFRRDLKCRKGKIISQGAHGAMMFMTNKLKGEVSDWNGKFYDDTMCSALFTYEEIEWMNGLFTKICLVVDDEAQLRALYNKAKETGLTVYMVIDAGLTEFAGVPTLTCIAIGPHESERIDAVTKGLDLF